MAYKISTSGMDELLGKLQKAGDAAHDIAAVGLYEGAGVMADAVSRAVRGIATKRFKYPAPPGKQRMPSPEEKAVLEAAQKGVAHFRDDGGSVNTSVGLNAAGYGTVAGRTKPVGLIANSINSGTSFMKKQPFYRRAESQSKGLALGKIDTKLREEVDKLSGD